MENIKLLPHNQDMVDRIEREMVFGSHKIFYSEATGLGKSFIFMYLVHKYFIGKKVLYICPKKHIWYNIQRYEEFGLIQDCVDMMCYANFNNIKEEHFGYDAIFIDEAHHLKTDIQGENILQVIESTLSTNPNAFVYGFTATPYIDNDMIGDLYFDTSVMGMDYAEAVINGLLKAITVAAAVVEEMDLTNEEMTEMRKVLNVESTYNTVRNLVNEFSNVKHWLVYFTTIAELNENIEYFERDFSEFKLFIIHSEVEDNENVIREFEEYNGKAMLVSVSMVLEGIHPRTVEGILLYRNVCNVHTLIQIMGRVGVMNMNLNPIVIDIYSSCETLMNSTMINRIINKTSDNINNRDYDYRDSIVLHSNTYKFIDFINFIYEFRNSKNVKEYRGIKWTTYVELSRILGKHDQYVYHMIYMGKTCEELIDIYLDGKPVYEYRGIKWTSDVELSRILGKSEGYVCIMIKNGKTREELIDIYLDGNPVYEYRGIKWTTHVELSIILGKSKGYVCQMIKKGKTCEDLIDIYLDSNPVYEYRGIKWTTNQELSRILGKSEGYVRRNIRMGKTREELIDIYLDGNPVYEYRGIKWTSDYELSRILGKSKGYVNQMINTGKTCEELIDIYLDGNPVYEYRGIKWTSDYELSRILGKNKGYVCLMIKKGKTREELIDIYLDKNN